MLEFNTTLEHKPNTELLELIKDFTYTINKGKIKHLLKTDLQFIEPTEYLITYPITLTIIEYKVSEKIKEEDQLRWVGLMNNYKNIAEEIVLKEVINDDFSL